MCGDCAHGDTNLSWSGNQAECEILALNRRRKVRAHHKGRQLRGAGCTQGEPEGPAPLFHGRDADLSIPCSKAHVQAGTNTAVLPSHPGPGTPPGSSILGRNRPSGEGD